MRLYATQYSLFGIAQGLQLLLYFLRHHSEWRFNVSFQILCSQLRYCGTQTFRVLFRQHLGDAKNTTSLWGKTQQDAFDQIQNLANKVI